jgi:hypothetical protein
MTRADQRLNSWRDREWGTTVGSGPHRRSEEGPLTANRKRSTLTYQL